MTAALAGGPAPGGRFRRHSALLVVSQAVLLAGGFLVHVAVGRGLGPERYGAFGLVSACLFVTEIALYGGLLLAIPRTVSSRPGVARGVLRGAAVWVTAAGLVLWGLAVVAAGPISYALGDPSIAPLFLPAFADLVPFCLYNVCVGLLDGFSAFERRTACAVAYMAVKVTAILGLMGIGLGVNGALVGNVVGSVAGLVVIAPFALRLVRNAPPEAPAAVRAAVRAVARQAVPVSAFGLGVQALLSLDLVVLGHLQGDRADVGRYVGAATLAKGPYFLLAAQAAVLVPMLGAALHRGDDGGRAAAAGLIEKELRFAMALLLPALAVVAATAPGTMAFALGEGYRPAGGVLPVLVAGLMGLALFRALATASMAGGRHRLVLAVLAASVGLDLVLCAAWIPRHGPSGAAAATLTACGLATLATLAWLRGVFPFRFPWASLLRIGAASAAGWAAASVAGDAGWPVWAGWAAGGGAVAAGMALAGEFRRG